MTERPITHHISSYVSWQGFECDRPAWLSADLRAAPANSRIDWRLVLENLHFGWPDDVIDQATALRDAELRHGAHNG